MSVMELYQYGVRPRPYVSGDFNLRKSNKKKILCTGNKFRIEQAHQTCSGSSSLVFDMLLKQTLAPPPGPACV